MQAGVLPSLVVLHPECGIEAFVGFGPNLKCPAIGWNIVDQTDHPKMERVTICAKRIWTEITDRGIHNLRPIGLQYVLLNCAIF